MELLIKQIISFRKELGLTQKDFAKKIKVSTIHYNAIENGRKNLTIPILERVAKSTNTQLLITFISKK